MRLDVLKATVGANLFFLFTTLAGQGTFPDLVENAYGLDQDLVNGIQYSNRYMRSEGHPYFLEDRFMNGSVSINGKIYQNVQLKYDLFSQRVEIKHDKISGRNYRYITISDRMEAFSLGEYEFRKLNIPEYPERYYQVINTRHFTCFVHWEKKLIPLENNVIYLDHFTNHRLYYWLELNGEIIAFNNRRAFARLFPGNMQREILKLFRQRHISFRNIGPDEILWTMEMVANLFNTEGQP
ncbi:MAG: hypothetical protein KAT38_09970 [Bacteroidales bacterium]|nr:hypothetical protein [Bacteroidales bacterium]